MIAYIRLLAGYFVYAIAALVAVPAVLLAHAAEVIGDVAEDILGDL